tara:strand:- start:1595 stop:2230 length:636 start_codon:yes stop_codon:yes gene_type:complete
MPKGYFKRLTPEQENYIKSHYLKKPVKQLATELGTTYGVIMRRLKKWGLEMPAEVIAKNRAAGRFKKGSVPFTKGKKQADYLSPEAIERTKKTRFRKGSVPHNVSPVGDGHVVTRRDSSNLYYKYIRISKGYWELYHRYLWRQHYGEIPEGQLVTFKDGDSLNVSIENLMLISKSENMLRNSLHNYPKEIVPTLALINKLEKQLKKLEHGK